MRDLSRSALIRTKFGPCAFRNSWHRVKRQANGAVTENSHEPHIRTHMKKRTELSKQAGGGARTRRFLHEVNRRGTDGPSASLLIPQRLRLISSSPSVLARPPLSTARTQPHPHPPAATLGNAKSAANRGFTQSCFKQPSRPTT